MRIYNFLEKYHDVSGIQNVLLNIHNSLKNRFPGVKIASFQPYSYVKKYMNMEEKDFCYINSVNELKGATVILHERGFCTKLVLLNRILSLNIRIIYVHHSLLKGKRLLTFFPDEIVGISDKVIENLTGYFCVKKKRIIKIYNGIPDLVKNIKIVLPNENAVKILHIGRICEGKQQLEIVKRLSENIDSRVYVDFMGTGDQYNELLQVTANSHNFRAIGFHSNVAEMIQKYDYVLLYSTIEGLPISLIEACMCGKPIICNDVGGNTEIGINGRNAFVVNEWNKLLEVLNKLPYIKAEEYIKMCMESRKIYDQKFTIDLFAENYINLINSK